MADTPEKKQSGSVKKPRKKRFTPLRITLLVVVVLLGLLGLKIILIFTAEPTISVDYLAKWNQISRPKNYDPNKNAAFDYAKAAESMTEFPEMLEDIGCNWLGVLSQDKLKELHNWVASNENTLIHIKRGAEKPYFWLKLNSKDDSLWMFDFEPEFDSLTNIMYLIGYKAQLEAMNGRIDNAFKLLTIGFRMTSQVANSEMTIVKFIGVSKESFFCDSALNILYFCHPSNTAINKFLENIRQLKRISTNELDFEFYKYGVWDIVQRTFTDDKQDNGHLFPTKYAKEQITCYMARLLWYFREPYIQKRSWVQKLKNVFDDLFNGDNNSETSQITIYSHIIYRALFGPDRKQTMEMIESDFKYFEKLKKMTLSQLKKQGIETEGDLIRKRSQHLFSGYLPPFYSYVESFSRGITRRSALVTTMAILQYKNDTGRLPQSLEQLVSEGYLNELPMDIYSDKPLVYRKTDDNFILYSYGADFDDDGGTYIDDYGIYVDWGEGEHGGDKVFWPVKRTLSFE